MTIPVERTWAVLNTREFLLNLLDPKKTPRVPKDIRRQASRLLKHYPTKYSFEEMVDKNSYEKVFGKTNEVF
jgi:hypothetical protein